MLFTKNKIKKKIYYSLFNNLNFLFEKKFLLIHFPKTAGTLLKIEIEEKKLYNKIIYFDHEKNYFRLSNKFINHQFIICIRNPLTWYISYYNNKLKSINKHKLFEKNEFNDFINDLVINQSTKSIKRWHIPNKKNTIMDLVAEIDNFNLGFLTKVFFMYAFKSPLKQIKNINNKTTLDDIKKNIGVNKIITYENLENFNSKILNDSNIKINFKRYENKGPNYSIGDYYSSNTIDILKEKDKFIFDLFY